MNMHIIAMPAENDRLDDRVIRRCGGVLIDLQSEFYRLCDELRKRRPGGPGLDIAERLDAIQGLAVTAAAGARDPYRMREVCWGDVPVERAAPTATPPQTVPSAPVDEAVLARLVRERRSIVDGDDEATSREEVPSEVVGERAAREWMKTASWRDINRASQAADLEDRDESASAFRDLVVAFVGPRPALLFDVNDRPWREAIGAVVGPIEDGVDLERWAVGFITACDAVLRKVEELRQA